MRKGHTLEALAFWQIFDRPNCSRGELGDRLGVSAATISRAVAVLVERGLVVESAAGVSAPGRKPQLLRVDPKLGTLLGLELEMDRVTAVVTDMSGELLGRCAVLCDAGRGVEAVIEAGREAIHGALADAGVSRRLIRHLGVGHSGDLDLAAGVCVSWADVPAWRGVPLRSRLQAALGFETTVDDRSRALALAERRTSPDDWGHPHAVYVLCGTGVGMGVFLDGRLFRGATGGGGEIGHMTIDPGGPPCKCGNTGCVEAFAGTEAVVRFVRDSVQAGAQSILGAAAPLTIEAVAAASRQGDRLANAAVERAASAIGTGVANAVQILHPSLVVLGGRFARVAGEELLHTVRKRVLTQCVETASRRVEIRLARPKKDISGIGCALLAAEMEAQRALQAGLTGARRAPV